MQVQLRSSGSTSFWLVMSVLAISIATLFAAIPLLTVLLGCMYLGHCF